jgi:ribose-phosphate pyrophosphokinase
MQGPLFFTTPAYQPLATEIAHLAHSELSVVEREVFPDGERYQRIMPSVDRRDCVIIGGTDTDGSTLDLFDLACGIVSGGAQTVSLVLPYFGYGTMDRDVKPGEIVTAKTRALLLSSVPRAASGNRIFLFDTHAEGLPYYFEGHLRTFHLYGEEILLPAIAALGGENFVLGTVDAGRAKWVGHFADKLGVDTAIILKRRLSGRHTEIDGLSAPVAGRPVIIYDDMIRSGGSLLSAATAYLKEGATYVGVVASHGIFAEEAAQKILASGLIRQIVVTDSHPRARTIAAQFPFIGIISCAPILAQPFLR